MSYKNYDTEELIEELAMRGNYLIQTAHDIKLVRKTNNLEKIFDKIQSIEHSEAETHKKLKKEIIENIDFQIKELQELNQEILNRKI